MTEFNPDNPLLKKIREQELWIKICAMLMSKLKQDEVRINSFDIRKLENKFAPDTPAVVLTVEKANTSDEELVLHLMDNTSAEKLARKDDLGRN